ncbi:hypothetical protein JCM19239_4733 [Vibrio variabilis]|uniref:Uncharacterized protein n=1 Tax=Vibrio variabilis TaxID=990271 RepID=A0ABQ0JRC1_9VIBR|nr:hypothetical protein JCM19239_4733 [Vibrio variabilis]
MIHIVFMSLIISALVLVYSGQFDFATQLAEWLFCLSSNFV